MRTVYTNQIGQVLLDSLVSGADSWNDLQQFDEDANRVLHAYPWAIVGFDDTQPDLGIVFNANSGWTIYQDSTESGAASEVWVGQGYATGSAPDYSFRAFPFSNLASARRIPQCW